MYTRGPSTCTAIYLEVWAHPWLSAEMEQGLAAQACGAPAQAWMQLPGVTDHIGAAAASRAGDAEAASEEALSQPAQCAKQLSVAEEPKGACAWSEVLPGTDKEKVNADEEDARADLWWCLDARCLTSKGCFDSEVGLLLHMCTHGHH